MFIRPINKSSGFDGGTAVITHAKNQANRHQGGFTLVEMLIVVIILGILAMIIIPQISISTDDAKLSSLQTNLSAMRGAIELYFHHHNGIYPGQKKTDGSGTDVANPTEASTAFLEQLTRYTSVAGEVSVTKDATYKYGPYIKAALLPMNPFNDKSDLLSDITTTDITARDSSGTDTGWKFYVKTGVFIAGDQGNHDTF